ncbi:MAG TPA: TonB-dependent receptor [Vicinamibacteria bacterium]|nr:TonB-dependent receptor [Vicinamibacteria bacterium]
MRRSFVFVFLLTVGLAEVGYAESHLSGTVLDAATGQPVAGARLSLLGREQATTTGPDGAFTLEAGAWPATLVVTKDGYRVARVEVPALPEQPLQVRLAPVISYSDRIEVTANRAREGVDPATFTNIPEQRVKEAYWGQDPAILMQDVAPGFTAYNDSGNGIGYSYFTVRGFGQAHTRVTLNGAPLNDAEDGELYFIDLADFLSTAGDIQLGRGVFGLSGIGGSLDITTTPNTGHAALVEGSLASFGTRRLTARYDSGLLGGRWAITGRLSGIHTDGYRDQSWVDEWNGFLSVSRFGAHSRLRFVSFGGPEQTHLAYDGVPKSTLEGGLTGDADVDRRYNPITWPGEIDHFLQPHFQLLHDVDFGGGTRLSQTFYAFRGDGYYEQYRAQADLVEYDLPGATLPDGTPVSTADVVRRRNIGEWDFGWVPTLVRVRGPWTFTVLGELRFHQAHHWGEVRLAQYDDGDGTFSDVYPPELAPNHHYYDYLVHKQTETGAVRLAWDASPRVTLSGGLQLTHDNYSMSQDLLKGMAFDQPYDFVLPRLGAVVHLGRDTDAYLNACRGGRSPNFNQLYDPEDYYGERATLAPEDVYDYEAGVSLRRASWRGRLNLFFMDFRNEIVWAGALDDNGVPIYGNGARSHHTGAELEGSWSPSRRFGLEGHLSLSHNTFVDYKEHEDDGSVVSYDGNRIAGYPDVMGALTVRTQLGPARISLSGRHVGRFYLDNTQDNRTDPQARQEPGYVPLINPSYTVFDAIVRADLPQRATQGLGGMRVGIELRVNNLFDRRYTPFGYVDTGPLFIPAATRSVYLGLSLGL